MTIKHHRHQQTTTGQWIDQCLQQEKAEKEKRKYVTLYQAVSRPDKPSSANKKVSVNEMIVLTEQLELLSAA